MLASVLPAQYGTESDASVARLKITALDEDGVLQRAVFEFSRRNIVLERLLYARERGKVVIQITVSEDTDARKVLKHLGKIYGVTEVESSCAESVFQPSAGKELSPQEMLG